MKLNAPEKPKLEERNPLQYARRAELYSDFFQV